MTGYFEYDNILKGLQHQSHQRMCFEVIDDDGAIWLVLIELFEFVAPNGYKAIINNAGQVKGVLRTMI